MKADRRVQSETGHLLRVSVCNNDTEKQGLESEVAIGRRTK